MGLDIYWTGLLVLAPAVAFSAGGHTAIIKPLKRFREKTRTRQGVGNEEAKGKTVQSSSSNDFGEETGCSIERRRKQFRRTFFQVYLLVMGSEWLQVSKTNTSSLTAFPA